MKSKFLPFYGYRLSIALLCLCSSPNLLLANTLEKDLATIDQNKITLSGTVSDESGPLPGVIVQVKSRNNATLSDHDGNYSIQVNQGDTVEFSYMGYITKNVTINNQENLNITLQQDSQQLDEIVVNAGYYTVKDREKTGNIVRVTAKDIENQPVLNPLQAIQGRMAGVSITQNSGVPGGGFDIQIRGRNSLRFYGTSSINASAPLYVIDGVVFPTSNLPNSDLSQSILPYNEVNILNSINPSDIESIEVLKDADATSIYGSRGANGVVLINTKKNKSEKLTFITSSSTSFSKVASKMKLLDTKEYNEMREEAFLNDGITDYPDYALDMNGVWDRNRYTDWQKELIGGTAISQNLQLGIKGGNRTTNFLVNTSQEKQTTVFPTSKGYKRNTLLLRINHTSTDDKFRLNASTNYSLQNNNLIATDLTKNSITLSPNAPSLYNANGTLNWNFMGDSNPISSMYETYSNDTNNLILNLDLTYNFFKNTFFKLNLGYNTNQTEEKRLTPHTIYNPDNNYTSEQSKSLLATRENKSYIIEPQITHKLTHKKLAVNSLIGLTYQENTTNSLQAIGSGFQSNDFISNIASAKAVAISQSANLKYKYIAIFGRLNLSYDNKYIVNLTARRDGSSRFGDNQKFGNFAAIGGAWLFTNENFFPTAKWLTFGKLRGSYGSSGNDNIGDYQYLDTYTLNPSRYDEITGLTPSRLYNPNFSWEKTKKLEFALELSLLQDKLQLELAWYRNTSSNQLVGVPLPSTTGFSTIQDNLEAKVENKGWEFSLHTEPLRTHNFYWKTNFNISFPKNTLLSFPNLEGSTYANLFIIGKSTNIKKLYSFDGIDPISGLYTFKDYNKDEKLTADNDKKHTGEIKVIYHGGIQNTLTYKKISLDFLFQFVKQTNFSYHYSMNTPGSMYNQPVELLNSWSKENPIGKYGYFTTGSDPLMANALSFFQESSAAISDASFIRLKNISLSYTLAIPKAKIESLSFYFQGQNLWTFTKYLGLDPEFTALGYLPPLKTYSIGIQLTF